MWCQLDNATPLAARLEPHRGADGRAQALLLVKATWSLASGRLAAAEHQRPLLDRPQRVALGDLDLDAAQRRALGERRHEDVVWLDHDSQPPKPAFDVIIAGYATAPTGHAEPELDAGVRIGEHSCIVKAHVPRVWRSDWLSLGSTALARTVRRVPLTHAVADWPGGFALQVEDGAPQLLPWLEAFGHAAQRKRHADVAAGFGPWPENAPHRMRHAGTFDDAWQRRRQPLLPADFNPRFFNQAHPDLQLSAAPAPGTVIRLNRLSLQARIETHMPDMPLRVQPRCANGQVLPAQPLRADTLVIEPDHDRMAIVWRHLQPLAEGAEALRTLRVFKA